MLISPTLVIEVLSDSTEAHDRIAKFALYRAQPSISAYLVIAQHTPHVELYRRQDGEVRLFREVSGLDGAIALESVGVTIPLSAMYATVTFP